MKKLDPKYIDHAVELKNAGKPKEAISELKRIMEEHGEFPVPIGMIASLYYSELNDPENALPYAKRSVQLSPKSEMASMCLVLCLYHYEKQDEMDVEIKRYVNEGGNIDLYSTLFEENGLKLADFT